MDTPSPDPERDALIAAALHERELSAAISYLDKTIGKFACQNAPSRWIASHPQMRRRSAPTARLAGVLNHCVAALRTEWRSLGNLHL